MEWVKLYTTFHDHRKTVELDANAIALWTVCLSWSGAQETDGLIPRRIAMRFLGGELGEEAAARLVRVGLWEEVEGGYRMRNWDERQTSATRREARREEWRDRKARQRAARAAIPEHGHAAGHAGFPRESRERPATREEESRQEQTACPPAPPRVVGEGSSKQPKTREDSPDEAVVAEYRSAFAEAHAGSPPAASLVSGIAAQVRRLRDEGHRQDELVAAVRRCAELSRGPGLLPVALAEVQANLPRQRGRPGRSELMDRWRRVNFGAPA
jgi:hypothetical protein